MPKNHHKSKSKNDPIVIKSPSSQGCESNPQQGSKTENKPVISNLPVKNQDALPTSESPINDSQIASGTAPPDKESLPEEPNSLHLSESTNEQEADQGTTPVQSVWITAYDYVVGKDENKEVIEKYDELLQEQSGEPKGAEDMTPEIRQDQLQRIIDKGIERQSEDEIKASLFGYKFGLSESASKLANFVLKMKDFVAEAVKASPEASLAWAGVCLVIPILTIPETAKEANSKGLTEITLRMRYYVKLEELVSKPPQKDKTDPVFGTFQSDLELLYKHVIEFQIKCAVRYYETRRTRLWSDFFTAEDWMGMVDEIKDLEDSLTVHLNTMTEQKNSQSVQEISKEIKKTRSIAEKSCKTQKNILDELKDIRDVLWEIAHHTKPPSNIPFTPDAYWNSRRNEVAAIKPCSPETRVKLLKQIADWAKDPSGKTILWLYASAGVGKSTIAYTVAQDLNKDEVRQLAATYFFRRGESEGKLRNDPIFFFPTICRQLVRTVPEFGPLLEDSLKEMESTGVGEDSIQSLSLESQFKYLIQLPLSRISPRASEAAAKVIVIDALDECEGPKPWDDIDQICKFLLQLSEIKELRLRILITSRHEDVIKKNFEAEDKTITDKAICPLNIQDVFLAETKKGYLSIPQRFLPEDSPGQGLFGSAFLAYSGNYESSSRAGYETLSTLHLCVDSCRFY